MLVHDGNETFPFPSHAIGIAIVFDETDIVLHYRVPVLCPQSGAVDMRLKRTYNQKRASIVPVSKDSMYLLMYCSSKAFAA